MAVTAKVPGAKMTCTKCHKTMQADKKFYAYKTGEKYELCKSCMTMHMDPFDEETFLWALEALDLPYVEDEWNIVRDKLYNENPATTTGIRVFGKYLSKMKLKQWKSYGWADNEMFAQQKRDALEKLANANPDIARREEVVRQQYENGEISESEFKTYMSSASLHAHDKVAMENERARQVQDAMNISMQTAAGPMGAATGPMMQGQGMTPDDNHDSFILGMQINADKTSGMSEEDKLYLISKWGSQYVAAELLELEKKYIEMCDSFDIQDSDTRGSLILLCKTYLKMNQAIDREDIEGYQKLSRVYDGLRKASKFTAAQNKEEKAEFVDSIGELVSICELDGFIPRYKTDIPKDKVDSTLKDMMQYVSSLIRNELGLSQMIDDALKKLVIQKEMEDEDENAELTDEDISAHYISIEEQKAEDLDALIDLGLEIEEDE